MGKEYIIEDHLCLSCNGRILKDTKPGMQPGGMQLYKCSICGEQANKIEDLCWCGMTYRNSKETPFICIHRDKIRFNVDLAYLGQKMGNNLELCEIAIINEEDYRQVLNMIQDRNRYEN